MNAIIKLSGITITIPITNLITIYYSDHECAIWFWDKDKIEYTGAVYVSNNKWQNKDCYFVLLSTSEVDITFI